MTISVGRFGRHFGNTCCYIITTDDDRTAVVIDPGQGSLEWVHHEVHQRNLTVASVLLTHGHMDHTWDAQPLAHSLGDVPVVLHSAGHRFMQSPEEALPSKFPMHLLRDHPHRTPEQLTAPQAMFEIGPLRLRTITTPGHTPCSVTYLIEAGGSVIACTGDTILGGGTPGEPISPLGNRAHLNRSIASLSGPLAGAIGLPGHGRAFRFPGITALESVENESRHVRRSGDQVE